MSKILKSFRFRANLGIEGLAETLGDPLELGPAAVRRDQAGTRTGEPLGAGWRSATTSAIVLLPGSPATRRPSSSSPTAPARQRSKAPKRMAARLETRIRIGMDASPTFPGAPPASPFPTGTVTFLFTDIEGSTRRWERDPKAMAEAVRLHDAIVSAAMTSYRGYIFKTGGDSLHAAFERVNDAIDAARAAQHALGAEDFSAVDGLRVRMSIHTGVADERAGDYFGPTVNRVARLLAIAHGGQVVVSEPSAKLLEEITAGSPALLDLGVHRLKDLSRPERVFQLLTPPLPATFPPLRSLATLANNLPLQQTSFIGRQREIAELQELLAAHRLVSIVGAGGVGKSRAALHVGASVSDAWPDGVWFVELAPIENASSLPLTIATAAHLDVTTERESEQHLLAALATKTTLLIFDNCEHLIQAVAQLTPSILKRSPGVKILCTSREHLNIGGEFVYRMPSLAVPAATAPDVLSVEDALGYSAIVLFVERAKAADQRFSLTDETAPIVAGICRRLDGIPLAIELAAVRTHVLSLKNLREGLNERFRLLTSGNRSALPRQQTLRTLIDWSYNLLDDDERRLLRRLSVFAAGFTLEAAERVGADSDIDAFDVLEVLTMLVEKSLIAVEGSFAGAWRYRLLETIREYAAEKLSDDPAHTEVRRRFALWMGELIDVAHRTWETEPSDDWDERFRPEVDNLRSALHWSLIEGTGVELGIAVVIAARRYWGRLAPAEGLAWILLARERWPPSDRSRQGALRLAEAQVRVALRQYEAASRAAGDALASLKAGRADAVTLAEAQGLAGYSLAHLGRHAEAIALLSSAAAEMRRLNSPHLAAYAAQDLALANLEAGNFEDARRFFNEALSGFRLTGNARGVVATQVNLAELASSAGDPVEAIRIISEVPRNGTSITGSLLAANLAAYYIAAERWHEARASALEALRTARDRGEPEVACAFQHAAAITILSDSATDRRARSIAALRVLGAADKRFQQLGIVREPNEERERARMIEEVMKMLSSEQVESLLSEGTQWHDERCLYEAYDLMKTQ